MAVDLILGTAGHIDHGKTALVKALTGVDTDRLPEERKRGITIDLGFARLELGEFRLGIVDVPGHERFVRNMLAGATGIDLALLVVAADDSVKPQTVEHLEILRLLNIQRGVVALTKCDVADPDWIDLVEEEVRERLEGTFLADAPIVRTSAVTGAGLPELREALTEAARVVAPLLPDVDERGAARMPIDRAFTIQGHGTVVTGSVSDGVIRLGEELVLEPGGIPVRVRSLENHGEAVELVRRGQRAAINLAGLDPDRFDRGQELASPGLLRPARCLTVRLRLLDDGPERLKHRARVRLHLGTAEVMGTVAFLDREDLRPGDWAFAQLFLSQPVVSTWNQPLVIRRESPLVTLGGGHVLDPDATRLKRRDEAALGQLETLVSGTADERTLASIWLRGWQEWSAEDLARLAGVKRGEVVCRRLVQQGELVEVPTSPTRVRRLHRRRVETLMGRIEEALGTLHTEHPIRPAIEVAKLSARFDWVGDAAVVHAIVERMAQMGRVRARGRLVALAEHQPSLSAAERELKKHIVQRCHEAKYQPPSQEELAREANRHGAVVADLIELAIDEGELTRVSHEYCLHHERETAMRETLRDAMDGGEGMTLSEIREMLGTTRKYAVPLCEYLDRVGVTERHGDVRVLKHSGLSVVGNDASANDSTIRELESREKRG